MIACTFFISVYSVRIMNADNKDMEITLPLLQSIEQQSDITQRSLAKRLGLALGLTNCYLKNCIQKGLIKIEQIPANRYLYYLTPKGFAEKSRLTAKYLATSFNFYRQASQSCMECYIVCQQHDWDSVVLAGISELTEIAIVQAGHAGIRIAGIYDTKAKQKELLQYPVYETLANVAADSVFLITVLKSPEKLQHQLQQHTSAEQILVPDILI